MNPSPLAPRHNSCGGPSRLPAAAVAPPYSEPLTGAQLQARGWSPADIFFAVDTGLVCPMRRARAGASWWEFSPKGSRAWPDVEREIGYDH